MDRTVAVAAVLALLIFSSGCLVSVKGLQFVTDKQAYASQENVHFSAKFDGLKFAWQGANISAVFHWNEQTLVWEPVNLGPIPARRQVCLPSGRMGEEIDPFPAAKPPVCRRLLNAESAWNGEEIMTTTATCEGQPYRQYRKSKVSGKFKSVLAIYNDPSCSSVNTTAEVEFTIQ